MATYSKEQTIHFPIEKVYAKASDLTFLNRMNERIPPGNKINFVADIDSVAIDVPTFGELKVGIIACKAPTFVKYQSLNSPFAFTIDVSFQQTTETETQVAVEIDADIPLFLKPLIEVQIKKILDKAEDYFNR